MRTINWIFESLDNGITLEDKDIGAKMAALIDEDKNSDAVIHLLGSWLYGEVKDFMEAEPTCKAKITINIEDTL